MPDTVLKNTTTQEKLNRFQFGLVDILMAVFVIALTLGVAKSWEIVGGIWAGLLAVAILAVIRRKTSGSVYLLVSLVAAFGIGTWIAWDGHVAAGGSLCRIQDRQIDYIWSDSAIFDAYSLVLYTGDFRRVDTKDRMLILPDRTITFPDDANVAVVNAVADVRFVTIPDRCFIRVRRSTGLYIAGIPLPHFRSNHDFKGSLDLNSLKKTRIWNDEIVPFLLQNGNGKKR